jgi:AcrR family transcriptional regulator
MSVKDRKERDFKRREQEILAAALKLSQTDRRQWVTIEQIAQAAEIGKGTVYKHFATKDEIYAVLALGFHHDVVTCLEQVPVSAKFEQRVRAVVRVFWEMYRQGKDYQRVVQYCERQDFRRGVSAETREKFEELDKRFARITSWLVQAGLDEGLLPKKPLALLTFGANAALYGGLHLGWGGCLDGRDSEKYLGELTDFILRGWIQKKTN